MGKLVIQPAIPVAMGGQQPLDPGTGIVCSPLVRVLRQLHRGAVQGTPGVGVHQPVHQPQRRGITSAISSQASHACAPAARGRRFRALR